MRNTVVRKKKGNLTTTCTGAYQEHSCKETQGNDEQDSQTQG